MARQIPLDLSTAPAFGRESFVESACNADALAALDRWPAWDTPTLLMLGPVGSGKTHLAHVFAARSGARFLTPADLARGARPAVGAETALIVEDADRARTDEVTLFHLLNTVREHAIPLLMTARTWPRAWPVALPDLKSRLTALPAVELHEPDDALLKTVLVKLFADRQLVPDPTVIAFLSRRMERSVAAAADIVEALDREALVEKRAVTRAMAARLLALRPETG